MSEVPTISYYLRKPKFPVFIIVEGNLVYGKSAITLSRRLSKIESLHEKDYNAVDRTGERWIFDPNRWSLYPPIGKNKWAKHELIDLYNGRINRKTEDPLYSEKSLSSKRLERILSDIFALLNKT
ncbi:MAG: hypothetical protein HOF10_06895 [Chloroflexi bacterium]|nr:hypothetical protein [Chloroflexota bacterium]